MNSVFKIFKGNFAELFAVAYTMFITWIVPTIFFAQMWGVKSRMDDDGGVTNDALLLGGAAMFILIVLGHLFIYRRPRFNPDACSTAVLMLTGIALLIDTVTFLILGHPTLFHHGARFEDVFDFVALHSLIGMGAAFATYAMKNGHAGLMKEEGGLW